MKNTQELIKELLELSKASRYINQHEGQETNQRFWRLNDEVTATKMDTLLNLICQLEDRRSLKLEDIETSNQWEKKWVYNIFHNLTVAEIFPTKDRHCLTLTFSDKYSAHEASTALIVVLNPEIEKDVASSILLPLEKHEVRALQVDLLGELKNIMAVRLDSDQSTNHAIIVYNTSEEACQRIESIISQGCNMSYPRPEMISGIDEFSDVEQSLLKLVFIGVKECYAVGILLLMFCRTESLAKTLHEELNKYVDEYLIKSIDEWAKRAEDRELGAYDKHHRFETIRHVLNKVKDVPYIADHEVNERAAGVMGVVEEAIREMEDPQYTDNYDEPQH